MSKKYAPTQIALHWGIFILVVLTYASMELRDLLSGTIVTRSVMKTAHYTLGVSVMVLMVIRIFVKIGHDDPEIVPVPPRWQTIASKSVHGILYLMFISLPLLGALSLYFGNVEWSFLGIAMPVSGAKNGVVQHDLKEIHEFIANTGYYLVGLHAAAALFHHYFMRDNTLIRMMPGK
ncbi:cytochrome b [Erwiniaceae bacterium CAU 1747]